MKELREKWIQTYGNGIKWLIIGILSGAVVGSIAAFFAKGIQVVSQFRQAHPLIIALLPFSGLLIVLSYHLFSVRNPKGTNLVLESVRDGQPLPYYMAPLIIFSTVISHLFGASVGREGAPASENFSA